MLELCLFVIISFIVAISTYTDLKRREIPDWLTKPAIVLGLIISLFRKYPDILGMMMVVLNIVVAFLISLPLWYAKLMGGGDVKLFVAYSAWLTKIFSPLLFILSIVLHSILTLIVAIIMVIKGKSVTLKTKISLPFAVSLGFAAVLIAFYPYILLLPGVSI